MSTQDGLKHIRKFFKTQRRLPTYQELADMMGFASKNAAYKLAQKLVDAGYLEKDEKGKLVPKRLFAPMMESGVVQAGFPTLADSYYEDMVSFDEYLIEDPENTFILKVSGDSMINAGVHDGDLVIVDRHQKVSFGDIVVAKVDDEWTLKYYQKTGQKIALVPANDNYPVIYPKESLEIAGIVVGVIRKYH